jgi:putative polyhydroxyalkanoate system protein
MNQIVVHRSHRLRLANAKRLAETMARRLQDEYGGSYAWDGDTLRFRRTGASGQVTVERRGVEIRVELGLLLTPLRSRIEGEIRAFCDEHFSDATTPDRGQRTRPAAGQREPTKSPRSPRSSRPVRPKEP